jgi:hypothetical protein
MAPVLTNISKIYLESGGPMKFIQVFNIWSQMFSFCKDSIIENPKLLKMIDANVKVDAVVTMMSCGSFLSHKFDSPLIWFSPGGPFSTMLTPGLGNPMNSMV